MKKIAKPMRIVTHNYWRVRRPHIITKWLDTDHDGVPDYKDCKPLDPKRQDKDYFFDKNDVVYIYNPVSYLEGRYNVPPEVTKGLALITTRDSEGKIGFKKSQLDSFGENR